MHRISASFAVGLNCPVSIELMVFRETPTIPARSACEIFCSVRTSFSRFLSIKLSSIGASLYKIVLVLKSVMIAVIIAATDISAYIEP